MNNKGLDMYRARAYRFRLVLVSISITSGIGISFTVLSSVRDSLAALPHHCRDGGGGAAAAGFLKFIATAAAFFSRTVKKCMNLIEF